MWRRVILVSLALLASPAGNGHAAPDQGDSSRAGRIASPTGLRGPVRAGFTAPAPRAAAVATLRPRLSLATPSPSAAAIEGQCRTGCAHDYYFCLSGSVAADCATTWGQCLSSCSYPRSTSLH